MAKLYPPIINGTIPAFYGTEIAVPFSMNRSVGSADFIDMNLKIKTITGVFKESITKSSRIDKEKSIAYFELRNPGAYNIGQYYKFQLAYVDTRGQEGYFSTVGVAKYTAEPEISIEGLDFGSLNGERFNYTGVFRETDVTEKLHSSIFNLYDFDQNLVETSGEIIHNTSYDVNSNEAIEVYTLKEKLEKGKIYYLEFIANSNNGVQIKTSRYKVHKSETLKADISGHLETELNYDNAYIKVAFINENNNVNETVLGNFVILRGSSKNNFKTEIIKYLSFDYEPIGNLVFYDFNIEQGVEYKYYIQQYNKYGLHSDEISTIGDQAIRADFEDMFLYDGQKQLKLRFNPKVATFKTNLLEAKMETIGNKYPFIFRNGRVGYKELSISGLVSFNMDEEGWFYFSETISAHEDDGKDKHVLLHSDVQRGDWVRENHRHSTPSEDNIEDYSLTDLTSNNIYRERLFKNEVNNWLQNGKPKLFKSSTEGNYLVQILNVSLSPSDQLGRMLHTVNCTAYEIAENNFDNLKYYGIIDSDKHLITKRQIRQILFADVYQKGITDDDGNYVLLSNADSDIVNLWIQDVLPGTKMKVYFTSGEQEIIIGGTGQFAYASTANPITRVTVSANEVDNFIEGSMLIQFEETSEMGFDKYADIQYSDIPLRRFYGDTAEGMEENLFNNINNKDDEITLVEKYLIRFSRMDIKPIYRYNKNYYELFEEDFPSGGQILAPCNLAEMPHLLFRLFEIELPSYNEIEINDNLFIDCKYGFYIKKDLGLYTYNSNNEDLLEEIKYSTNANEIFKITLTLNENVEGKNPVSLNIKDYYDIDDKYLGYLSFNPGEYMHTSFEDQKDGPFNLDRENNTRHWQNPNIAHYDYCTEDSANKYWGDFDGQYYQISQDKLKDIVSIKIGPGIFCEMSYSIKKMITREEWEREHNG